MRLFLLAVILATVVARAAPAHAEGEGPDYRPLSVTWSPIHLVLPVIELTAEYIPAPKFGIAVVGGAGRVSDSTDTVTATAYEAGAQFNYYVMRSASGLHLGAEAIYLHVGDVAQDQSINAAGLAIGPYAGYKLVTQIGFTFVAQLGVQFAAYKAESSTQMESDKKVFPLLNLNVGWSF